MSQPSRPVPIDRSALLVIDVQDSFVALPRWERGNNPAFEANLTRLVDGPDGAELGVEAIVERTEYALRGRFARIATVAEIVAELHASEAACRV